MPHRLGEQVPLDYEARMATRPVKTHSGHMERQSEACEATTSKVDIYIYIYIYICVYVYVYIYIYIFTHRER